MNRCSTTRARLAVSALAVALAGPALLAAPAAAQVPTMQRSAPRDVVLGKMRVTAPPVILMNGQPDRLSPGSRIRNTNNMMVLSASIVNQELPVVYKRDPSGLVHEVWILTGEEYARLGGVDVTGDPQGVVRFAELLALIFSLRP